MPRLKTFLRLGRRDRMAFARAWSYLAAAKLGIRFLGLSRTLRLVAPPALAVPAQAEWPDAARWLHVATRYWPDGNNCLGRSVALLGLLRRAGIAAELHIGVRPPPDFEAHAWIELDGRPLNPERCS
jgi:hypothetical protein